MVKVPANVFPLRVQSHFFTDIGGTDQVATRRIPGLRQSGSAYRCPHESGFHTPRQKAAGDGRAVLPSS